jgi:hypothetical protein
VVHDSIPKRRGADFPPLGLVKVEMDIGAGPVAVALQCFLKLKQTIR